VPTGIIHGDLFRDNVLFMEREGDHHAHIAALLDFESASTGRFVYDIAVCILAWCVGDRLDCELARAMIEGYQSERSLTNPERAGMIAELATAALRFTITRITDYAMREGLGIKVVKDWRRFYARLEQVERLHRSELVGDN
jgi:homoserine kinase type II